MKSLADDFGLKPQILNDLAALITWRASRIKRLDVLSALPPEKLVVAGDPGWPGLLALPPLNFQPPVDYYAGLADFYQESQINLNITSAQMKTGLNQRVFDVPASCSFLLTDAQEQLAALFEPGREVAVYQNPQEAAELAAWYAAHDEARSAVASAGLRRVRREHLYRHRLAEVLRLMVK